jgi:serine/threonine protein kinase
LSPAAANVLVKLADNVVKLGDWGLARTWSDSSQRLTDHVVTLWYRAPELLMGQGSYTSAIDLWSMGWVFELRTMR